MMLILITFLVGSVLIAHWVRNTLKEEKGADDAIKEILRIGKL